MIVDWLSLEDFRNHASTELTLHEDLTLVVGPNGHGKTNLLEAIALLGGAGSFRGASAETMVRAGVQRAYVRAEVRRERRRQRVEMEIAAAGRSRVQVNGERRRSLRDLADVFSAVVFCPADLAIGSGAPSVRRALLDDLGCVLDRSYRATRLDFERILRQRNQLLKQAGRSLDADASRTLEVWDAQLAAAGETIAAERSLLCAALTPLAQEAYCRVAGAEARVVLSYSAEWRDRSLADTLERVRADDLRRGTTTLGPHRDDMRILLNGLPVRTHASQGELRTIALALRVAQHRHTAAGTGATPMVLLDDVFSELDEGRAARLVGCLPSAQTVLTSATGHVPRGIDAGRCVEVLHGEVLDDGQRTAGQYPSNVCAADHRSPRP